MDANSEYPYYRQPSRPVKRKHRARGRLFLWVATLVLPVVLLLFFGNYLWDGILLLRDSFLEVYCAFVPGEEGPTISFTYPEPMDTTAPILQGIHDFAVYQGDTISYMSGITATDDADADPTVTVDSSDVDLSQPGNYTVIYTATDASGNTSREAATVTVMEKQEGFVDLDTIYAAADAKLKEIIRENATMKQQIHDVYAWARLNLSYGGHSDRTDWLQTAYGMLTEGRGDCYGFWAVTKLLFERLEIPNIDVRKVRNSAEDTDHFWSLLSLDGGVTWYHFDSTPRYGDGDDFCLVTDAFIDAYSDSHEGSHNRDKSLYPETP